MATIIFMNINVTKTEYLYNLYNYISNMTSIITIELKKQCSMKI